MEFEFKTEKRSTESKRRPAEPEEKFVFKARKMP